MKPLISLIVSLLLASPVLAQGDEGGAWPTKANSRFGKTSVEQVLGGDERQIKLASQTKGWDNPDEKFAGRGIFKTNVDAVFDGGGQAPGSAAPLTIEPGLYELGGIASGSKTTHYFLFEQDVNNPNDYLAIVFPKSLKHHSRDTGFILEAMPFGAGNELVLTDFIIDQLGNASNQNKYATRGNHIRIVPNGRDGGPVFYLKGDHPLLNGKHVWGLKSSCKRRPRLGLPQTGVYGGDRNSPEALISRGEISWGNFNYGLVPLNGENGSIVGLTRSEVNIMMGVGVGETEIVRLLVFIEDFWETDVILDIRPHNVHGRFDFRYVETNFSEENIFESIGRFFNSIISGN